MGEVVATCSTAAGTAGSAGKVPRYWLVSPGGAGFESTFNTIRAFLEA